MYMHIYIYIYICVYMYIGWTRAARRTQLYLPSLLESGKGQQNGGDCN